MSPALDSLTPAALCAALRGMEPRPAAVLSRRLLEDRTSDACAAFYGVSREAFSVLLLRAALSLAKATRLTARPPMDEHEETLWARMLTESLDGTTSPGLAALGPTVEVCRRLKAARVEVRAALEAAEREEESSPRHHREEWIRRILVAVLLAVTAYLYWTRPTEPPARPVYPGRIHH